MREDVRKGVYVENLTEVEVNSVQDVIQLLSQVRSTTPPDMVGWNFVSEAVLMGIHRGLFSGIFQQEGGGHQHEQRVQPLS